MNSLTLDQVKLPPILGATNHMRNNSKSPENSIKIKNLLNNQLNTSRIYKHNRSPAKLTQDSISLESKIMDNKTIPKHIDEDNHLKKEIALSENRIRSVRAGKPLNFIFPSSPPRFVEPKRENYHRDHLGTPQTEQFSNGLIYTGRKRHVSLMNSSAHMPYLKLPSLKEVILNAGAKKQAFLDGEEDLSKKIEKLERIYHHKPVEKNEIKDLPKSNLVSPRMIGSILEEKNSSQEYDPVFQLFQRCKEFEEGKETINKKLNDLLATLKFDRSEAVWLKRKHFKTSEKRSVFQGKLLDLWNMRIEAEKERLERYRGMISQVCWYRDLLWFAVGKCQDISPSTYYLLDYIKSMTEEGIEVKRNDIEKAINKISQKERTAGIEVLIEKILSDLS